MEPQPDMLKMVAEKIAGVPGRASTVLLNHFLNDSICGEKCILSPKPLGSWCQDGCLLGGGDDFWHCRV